MWGQNQCLPPVEDAGCFRGYKITVSWKNRLQLQWSFSGGYSSRHDRMTCWLKRPRVKRSQVLPRLVFFRGISTVIGNYTQRYTLAASAVTV